MNILLCDNSIEGIFSAIYSAFQNRMKPSQTKIQPQGIDNLELFASYEEIPTSPERALQVSLTLCNRLGYQVYYDLCSALHCEEPYAINIGDAVYHGIALGFAMKDRGNQVLTTLSDPYIHTIFRCARTTHREAQHLYGFTRFRELKDKILFADIAPKNYILPFLIAHFDNRMPLENYIIYDHQRDLAAIHRPRQQSMLLSHPNFDPEAIRTYSKEELLYEELWINFFHSIAIESRTNEALQMHNIPKRFWPYTVELKDFNHT